MKSSRKAGFIDALEARGHGRKKRLRRLGIPRSTYYRWKNRYEAEGVKGLERIGKRAWNRLTRAEELEVLRVAMAHPELSPRLVACRVIDESGFSLSESTAYRLLKREGLVRLRPVEEQPAGKAWEHKTQRPDEIWQCDAKNFLIPGWGHYKAIPVLDDYSAHRNVVLKIAPERPLINALTQAAPHPALE